MTCRLSSFMNFSPTITAFSSIRMAYVYFGSNDVTATTYYHEVIVSIKGEFCQVYLDMLIWQAREWGRRCMINGYSRGKRINAAIRAKALVNICKLQYSFCFELDYFPIRKSEKRKKKKLHVADEKNGGLRKSLSNMKCIFCNGNTSFYGVLKTLN